jgi:hypothetical protein
MFASRQCYRNFEAMKVPYWLWVFTVYYFTVSVNEFILWVCMLISLHSEFLSPLNSVTLRSVYIPSELHLLNIYIRVFRIVFDINRKRWTCHICYERTQVSMCGHVQTEWYVNGHIKDFHLMTRLGVYVNTSIII